jgi:hypothetical protein
VGLAAAQLMAKRRSERHVRKSKDTLATPAARSSEERALALSPDGRSRGLIPASAAAAMAGYPSGVPQALGGTTTPDATGQIGTPGTLNVFGFLSGEDYNPDLDGFNMFANYNKMRLSDAQVNATLLLLKLPMKAADWTAEPASDDPQDIAIADFVQANLIDDEALARSWQHVLDNAMLKFDFGCSAEEITWTLGEAGEARIADLAPRLPRTFYRWVEDPETNKLAYLQQFAPKNGQYGFWNIPADQLVLHVRAREGNNYYGKAVLRTAYPHWWWKQQLYRIDMIGHDRFHVGIPRAVLGEKYNANSAPLDKIEATLKGLRSHDRAYMVQPYGVTYDIYAQPQSGGGTSTILLSVEHHNLMIARNILQGFSTQGEQRHGSFGAAKVLSDVFFDAIMGEANEIGAEFKHSVAKKLVDLNFDMRGGRPHPDIKCADIAAIDFNQLSTSLAALTDKRLITPEDDLESWLRHLADAPGLPDALKGQSRAPVVTVPGFPPKTPAPGPADPPDPPAPILASKRTPYLEAGRSFAREPNAFERRVFNLHAVPSRLEAEHAHLLRTMAGIRRTQLTTVAKRLAQKDGRPSTRAFTDMRHTHVAMPQVDAMERAIKVTQRAVLAFGREQVRQELERQGVTLPTELAKKKTTAAANKSTARSALVTSAKVTAKKQGDAWQARIMETGIRLRRVGIQGDDLAAKIVADLEDEIESGAKRDASQEVNEAFGLGRAQEAEALSDQIEEATYSAILDVNTCDACAELDGDTFQTDSAEYEANMPPNVNCDGRDSCRCVYLYTAKEGGA